MELTPKRFLLLLSGAELVRSSLLLSGRPVPVSLLRLLRDWTPILNCVVESNVDGWMKAADSSDGGGDVVVFYVSSTSGERLGTGPRDRRIDVRVTPC